MMMMALVRKGIAITQILIGVAAIQFEAVPIIFAQVMLPIGLLALTLEAGSLLRIRSVVVLRPGTRRETFLLGFPDADLRAAGISQDGN